MPIHFVYFIAFVTQFGSGASRVVLTLYALKLGASPFMIGILATTVAVWAMLLSWPIGKWSDRFGSRWPLMCGAVAAVAAMLVPHFASGLPAVLGAGALSGISQAFFMVTMQNLVGQVSALGDRTRNYSTYTLFTAIGNFIAPVLVGYSIDHSGFAHTFVLLAALALVPVVALWLWSARLPGGTRKDTPAGSLGMLLGEPKVRRLLLITSAQHCAQDAFQFYLPVYANGIGLPASVIGLVLASYFAAMFASRAILARLLAALGDEKVLTSVLLIAAASILLLPFLNAGAILGVFAFMLGLGIGCGTPITMMLMYNLSPEGGSGAALGLRLTIIQLTRVSGPLMWGAVSAAFGLLPIFWSNAVLLASAAALNGRK